MLMNISIRRGGEPGPAHCLRVHRTRRASWEAFEAIVRSLRELENDETLLVQSGKPVGVFGPRRSTAVLIANSNLVGMVEFDGVSPAGGAWG